jgi:hypothetical protein
MDGGTTWQDIFVQPGLPDNQQPVESAFSQRTLSLSNYVGQAILLRFNYAYTGGEYWPYSDPGTGWDLENIVVTNAQQLINPAANSTASTNFIFTPAQTGNYLLEAAPVIFSQFPLNYGPVELVSIIAGTNPVIVMNQPVLADKQVLLNFTVGNLTNATFHLLQATQLNNVSWTTNATAVFTTNVLNNSYLFTATNNSTLRFYRVQTP